MSPPAAVVKVDTLTARNNVTIIMSPAAVVKVDTLTARNVTKKKWGRGGATTKYMWDELTDTQDLCAKRCQVRDP
jgi:hypothetical protein